MRKILKLSIYLSAIAMLLAGGTGCLKDKLADDQMTIPDIKSSPSVIEVLGARESVSQMISFAASLLSSDQDTTLSLVFIRLAADQPAPEDIQVELELVPALITAFNTATGGHYVEPAANLYKFGSGLTVTIPKGSREGGLSFTTKPSALVGPEYAFGVRVKSVSNPKYLISGNHNSAVVLVGVRNKYDGDYTLRVNTTGWAAYGISDGVSRTYPLETSMITASATSVALFNQYFGAGLVPAFTSTGDATAFGGATPLFTFDPATDKLISVVNTTPPDARNRAFALHPTVTDSRFDPATKTMYLAYVLKQSGRPDMAIYDTLTYVGPRD
jgi:hypothetical protein